MPLNKQLRYFLLLSSVFLTGMAILIIEILATRILAPYFGNTIFTFSSVISIILAALSIGYYLGGRLSDWKTKDSLFYQLVLLGGLATLLLHFLSISVLPELSYKLNMIQGPLVMSLILFFLPAFFLAFLSPYAIKLLEGYFTEQRLGRNIGNVFFWSTIGSIVGSLSTGFILIPHFSVNTIISSVGYGLLLLAGFGLLVIARKNIKWMIGIFIIIVIHFIIIQKTATEQNFNAIYSEQGVYEQITIRDKQFQSRPARFLLQDKNTNSVMFLDDHSMALDYTKYYELYKLFAPQTKRVLAIGGGAYSVPKSLLETEADIVIDVAEIEPSLYPIAKKYFSLPENPNLRNHIMDGRRFLHDSPEHYDMIFSDVYRAFASVPMHFATREFFQLTSNRLNKGGVFIANYFGSLSEDNRSMIDSILKTMRSTFLQVYVFAIVDPNKDSMQNFIFVGHNNKHRLNLSQSAAIEYDFSDLKNLVDKEYIPDEKNLRDVPLFTDNYAPIEYLATNLIRQYDTLLREIQK